MKNSKQHHKHMEDQAAYWAIRLDEGLSEAEERAFSEWLDTSGAAERLRHYQSAWDRFEVLVETEGYTAATSLMREPPGPQRVLFQLARRHLIAISAVAALFVATAFLVGFMTGSNDSQAAPLRTQINYAQTDYYELEDHSLVELNSGTTLEYAYTKEARRIWVNSGEAYFTVAKDPERPFEVYIGDSVVRALGTQFNVKYNNSSVEILVTEGAVEIALLEAATQGLITPEPVRSKALTTRQKAIIYTSQEADPSLVVNTIEAQEVQVRMAWKPATLTFDSTPLAEVVQAFNAHNATKLIIEDDSLNDIEIVATFRSNKLKGFVHLLEATSGVQAEYRKDTIVLKRP